MVPVTASRGLRRGRLRDLTEEVRGTARGARASRRLLTWAAIITACLGALLVAATSFDARIESALLDLPGLGALGRIGLGGPVTYYVSPSGADSASGTTPGHAWRTLRRASRVVLRPADRLLLRGGARYPGTLRLGSPDGGDAARPVLVSSYGTGRAVITSHGSGIVVADAGGIDIANIDLTGTGADATTAGINLFSDRRQGPRYAHIVITGVTISGFGNGIALAAAHDVGFADVRVGHAVLRGNLRAGLISFGPRFDPLAPRYAHSNLDISHVTAIKNLGDPKITRGSSGSGIVLGSVQQATVAWSTATGNGGSGGASGEGPFGIWAYDSLGVVFEHDRALANTSNNRYDGGGFALDKNTSGCVVQYNLSYGNWGAGYQIYSAQRDQAARDNIIRFNSSTDDSRTYQMSGSIILNGYTSDSLVYRNTIIASSPPGSLHSALYLGQNIHGNTIRGNILETRLPGPIVRAAAPLGTTAVRLLENDYYSAAASWQILWGQTSYLTLAGFRAGTGQERLGGRDVGRTVKP